MFSFLKELFCFHVYEYEQDPQGHVTKICRKCGKNQHRILA